MPVHYNSSNNNNSIVRGGEKVTRPLLTAGFLSREENIYASFTPKKKLRISYREAIREKVTAPIFSRSPQTAQLRETLSQLHLFSARGGGGGDKICKPVYLLCRVCCTYAEGSMIKTVANHFNTLAPSTQLSHFTHLSHTK